MIGFPALNTIQPVIGVDMHLTIPPPPPAPPPHTPHVVVWVVGLSQKINFLGMAIGTSKACSPESLVARPVTAGWGYACGRTHDAGPHPGHIWVNLLLPLIMLGSSNKHEFGAGTVQTPQGDMAVGMAYVVDPGLDCYDLPYPPLPTGFAITALNTVYAGMGLADFGRGLIQMLADAAITYALNRAFAGIGGALSRRFSALASSQGSFFASNAPGFFARHGRLFIDSLRAFIPAAGRALRHPIFWYGVGEAGAKWVVGSPMGASVDSVRDPAAASANPISPFGWATSGEHTNYNKMINDLWR